MIFNNFFFFQVLVVILDFCGNFRGKYRELVDNIGWVDDTHNNASFMLTSVFRYYTSFDNHVNYVYFPVEICKDWCRCFLMF